MILFLVVIMKEPLLFIDKKLVNNFFENFIFDRTNGLSNWCEKVIKSICNFD